MTRTTLIFLLSDLLKFSYAFIFWASLIYIILQGYYLHKKFVFNSKSHNFKKYFIVNFIFAIFDFFISTFLKNSLSLYSISFVFSSIFTSLLRFLIYKKYVFK